MAQKTLTHLQFLTLSKIAEANKDSLPNFTSWTDATAFLNGKLAEAGHEFLSSKHSTQHIYEFLKINLKKRKQSSKRDKGELADTIDVLTRAIARLYDKLGEPMTEGLKRCLALSRKEITVEEARSSQRCGEGSYSNCT